MSAGPVSASGLSESCSGAAAAVLGVALAVLAMAAPAQAISSAAIVRVINAERQVNGLPLVREDYGLSAGCAAHDSYELRNARTPDEVFKHSEDPSNPGYSAAGDRCAHSALLAFGSRSSSDPFNNDNWASGDVFDNAPGHLIQLMSPDLQTVGADQFIASGKFGVPQLFNSSIDVRSARRRKPPRRLRGYVYWGPNGPHHFPASASYFEGPTAGRSSGPLIFIYFLAPKNTKITLTALTLTLRGGAPVPLTSFVTGGLIDGRPRSARAPTANVSGGSGASAVELFAKRPLTPGTYDLGVKTTPPFPPDVGSTGQAV